MVFRNTRFVFLIASSLTYPELYAFVIFLLRTTRYTVVIPWVSAALTEEEHENVMWYTYLEFLAKAVQGERGQQNGKSTSL